MTDELCKKIGLECWCTHKGNAISVCGHPNGYNGDYYSLAMDSSHSPWTIIQSLGNKPHSNSCASDDRQGCDGDCATNVCDSSGCWGSRHTCWNNEERWSRKLNGIVRCTNMEGILIFLSVFKYTDA